MKLEIMARKYGWNSETKLAKLVKTLVDKTLTCYSNLPDMVRKNCNMAQKKFNVQFEPKELACTARNKLKALEIRKD